MAKHTPGPWEYDYGIVPPDGPEKYSDIYVIGDDREPIIIAEFNNCIPEGLANARLIAAAPDLLAVLKHAVHWHDQLRATDVKRMEDAIAKAEGR